MDSIISIKGLSKTYKTGFEALKSVNLEIKRGEILALLGPNGAGKTTLISTICGIISPSSGSVKIFDIDIDQDFPEAKRMLGLLLKKLILVVLKEFLI